MLDITSQRPTWADINLDNLAANFHSVKEFVGRRVKYMAVVKADAYGHELFVVRGVLKLRVLTGSA